MIFLRNAKVFGFSEIRTQTQYSPNNSEDTDFQCCL